ncbi:MAG: tyrosine-type recombinase/integrase [Bacillota bacterium]
MFYQFLEDLRKQGKSDLTIRQYRSSWDKFVRWLEAEGGYTPGMGGPSNRGKGSDTDTQFFKTSEADGSKADPSLYAIHATQLDIANFKRWASQNFKPRTVSLNLIHLGVIFRWFVDRGIIPDNPCEHVDNVTVQQEAPKWLTRNEQNALIRAVRKHGDNRELTIITILLHTGLRVQELCDIRLKDLDITDRKGKVIVQSGKGGKYREVPLNLDARQAVQEYLAERRSDSQYLFVTQRSPKMTTRAVQFILQKYSRLTGIEVTPHVLRHTFCHELAVRKVPLDVIARLAGHSKKDGTPNLAMVTRYTLPNEDDLARAVEELSWR